MTTPVTIIQNSSDNSLQLLKTNQKNDNLLNQVSLYEFKFGFSNSLLFYYKFQVNLNNIVTNVYQESDTTAIEIINVDSQDYQVNNNKDCQVQVIAESLDDTVQSNVTSIENAIVEIVPEVQEKQTITKPEVTPVLKDVNLKKNIPSPKKYARKNIGRSKKNKSANLEVNLVII
jgi:hypothetical protein